MKSLISTPCIRCNKTNYPIGNKTKYGPVCPACAVYFRPEKQCPVCREPSKLLSRSKHLKHNLAVCLKCQRKEHKTCPSCHHHRLLIVSKTGEKLCSKCLFGNTKTCPQCLSKMPAGRTKYCVECTWQNTFERRVKIGSQVLTHHYTKNIFNQYCIWLSHTFAYNRAALIVNGDLYFFLNIDTNWKFLPTYEELLIHFTPEGLRHHRRVMSWLSENHFIVVNNDLKHELSEKLQITKKMLLIPEKSLCFALISSYYQFLQEKLHAEKIKLRTMRLALSTAIEFLHNKKFGYTQLPNQKELTQFICEKPGQKSNLTGFVNHINVTFNLDLDLNIAPQVARHFKQKKLQKKIEKLLEEHLTEDKSLSEKFIRTWIQYSLILYHNCSESKANKISKKCIITEYIGSEIISFNGKTYFLPSFILTKF